MSQKQAKRLRRIEKDIAELYIAQSKTVFLVGNLAAKFQQEIQPTVW